MKFADIPKFPHCCYVIDVSLDRLKGYLDDLASDHIVELNPDFQRGHVWTEEQQIKYVEFILKEPMKSTNTSFIFNCTTWDNLRHDSVLQCVDGLQRITALLKFMNNEIPAYGTLYRDYEDSRYLKRIFLQIYINNLPHKVDVLNYYIDLNAGGTIHSQEEIDRVKQMIDDFYYPPVPESEYGVHRTHCCSKHGCKYGNRHKCPVQNGTIKQDFPCHDCIYEGDDSF